MKLVVTTSSNMEALGERLGLVATAGDVIVLSGALGAGKTTFARGFGRSLNLEAPVSSPTFVVARTHRSLTPGAPALVHLDAYRLGSAGELDDLDIDVANSIVLAEWAAPYVSVLSTKWLDIELVRPSGGDGVDVESDEPREVTLTAHGDDTSLFQRFVDQAVGA
jgi:tRNA threonylcarbamoyl adenosine modification protein YjeE